MAKIKLVTYGIKKSGSSYLSQVCANALKLNLNQPGPYARLINFARTSDDVLDLLNSNDNLVIKTHLAAAKSLPRMKDDVNVCQLASVRDPREIALSHFDHSQRNWKRNPENPEPPRATTLDESINAVKSDWMERFHSYIKNDAITVFFYEEIFDTHQYVKKVLNASKLEVALDNLIDRLSGMEIWQMNVGVHDRLALEEPSIVSLLNESFTVEKEAYREALNKLT